MLILCLQHSYSLPKYTILVPVLDSHQHPALGGLTRLATMRSGATIITISNRCHPREENLIQLPMMSSTNQGDQPGEPCNFLGGISTDDFNLAISIDDIGER